MTNSEQLLQGSTPRVKSKSVMALRLRAIWRDPRSDLLLLSLVMALLFVLALISPPIGTHGESREGLMVQDILRNQSWILPHANGEIAWKPPLFYWVGAVLGHLFGQSDLTLRLTSIIAAEVMAISTFLLGNAMGGRCTAWLGLGALMGMYYFWDAGTQARIDMLFAAGAVVSITGFFFWYRDFGRTGRTVCYLAAAFAVLAKGPVGILLPGLVVVGFLTLQRRPDLIWRFWSWPLVGIVLLVDLGWYGLAYQVGGVAFLKRQILEENIGQFFATEGFNPQRERFMTAVWLGITLFPWNLVLIWSLFQRMRGGREDLYGRFLHVWWIAIFGVFLAAAGKRSIYLLPLFPAVALLAGRALARAIEPSSDQVSTSRAAPASSSVQSVRTKPLKFALAIAALDLAVVVALPIVRWRQREALSQYSFAAKVRRLVPTDAPLFASLDLKGTDLQIFAYRLSRQISRSEIKCADHDYYMLAPANSNKLPRTDYEVLSKFERDNKSLVLVLVRKEKECSGASM
jgi:4-amino-4-deoxy-L-arabinose transferase-like glycosyltransferase